MLIGKTTITQITAPGNGDIYDLGKVLPKNAEVEVTLATVETNVVLKMQYCDASNFSSVINGKSYTLTANGTYVFPVAKGYKYLRLILVSESNTGILTGLDVDTIAWQSGTTVRYTFNGTPDLSAVAAGDSLVVASATNASNNGTFIITTVNDGSDYIQVTNALRTDNTLDEATDSPATASTVPVGAATIDAVYKVFG